MELKQALLSRKSCRIYTDKKVEGEKLETVVTAGSLAPLGLPRECKPHLTVVTAPDMLRTLDGLFGPEREVIYHAPALILVSCPPSAPGIPEMNSACVVEMMSLMATDLGLGSIYLYGVCAGVQKDPGLMKALAIPEGYTPLSALALGYGAEPVAPCKTFAPVFTRNDI